MCATVNDLPDTIIAYILWLAYSKHAYSTCKKFSMLNILTLPPSYHSKINNLPLIYAPTKHVSLLILYRGNDPTYPKFKLAAITNYNYCICAIKPGRKCNAHPYDIVNNMNLFHVYEPLYMSDKHISVGYYNLVLEWKDYNSKEIKETDPIYGTLSL